MKYLLHIAKQSPYNFITVYEQQNNYPFIIGTCIYNCINEVYIRQTQVLLLTMQNHTEGGIIKYTMFSSIVNTRTSIVSTSDWLC
jgi:hypothetical protein